MDSVPRWVWWALGIAVAGLVLLYVFRMFSAKPAAGAPTAEPQPLNTLSAADDLALVDYADQQTGNWQMVLDAINAQNGGLAASTGGSSNNVGDTVGVILPGAGSGTVPQSGGTATA